MTNKIATTIAEQIATYLQREIKKNAEFLDNTFAHTQYQYDNLEETDTETLQNSSSFIRQAILKEMISRLPNADQANVEHKWRWIVNMWGGIKKFDVSKRVKECHNQETYNGNVDSYRLTCKVPCLI